MKKDSHKIKMFAIHLKNAYRFLLENFPKQKMTKCEFELKPHNVESLESFKLCFRLVRYRVSILYIQIFYNMKTIVKTFQTFHIVRLLIKNATTFLDKTAYIPDTMQFDLVLDFQLFVFLPLSNNRKV